MIIGTAAGYKANWPFLHLEADAQSCVHCHTCPENDPMSLPVEQMV